MRCRTITLAVALAATALVVRPGALCAHEFWLDPQRYRIEAGAELIVDIRNGQDFAGDAFPYLPGRYRELYLLGHDTRVPLTGRTGDYPAVRQQIERAGDYTVVLESTENAVEHDTLADFREYLAYHGLERVEARHRELGLPDSGIREIYSRFAKSLVGVGPADSVAATLPPRADLLFEIVVDADPRSALTTTLPVSVRFHGRSLTGAQLEIFRRDPDGAVTREVVVTDARGIATIDITRSGEYLLNAVQVILPRLRGGQARADAHWESLWASLTFERP